MDEIKTVTTATETKQSRWRSKVLWAAILAQIVSILMMVGVIDVGMGEVINNVGGGVLQLLALFGIINNPTDSAHM